jgi:hypothetical protein
MKVQARACGADNHFKIGGGGDDSVLWLSFAQEKYLQVAGFVDIAVCLGNTSL